MKPLESGSNIPVTNIPVISATGMLKQRDAEDQPGSIYIHT